MSVIETVPTPAWVMPHETPESVDRAKLAFLLRLAALYHNGTGSLSELSLGLGMSDSVLHMAIKRGSNVTGEVAVAIERTLGRDLFPRELFRPDLFTIDAE